MVNVFVRLINFVFNDIFCTDCLQLFLMSTLTYQVFHAYCLTLNKIGLSFSSSLWYIFLFFFLYDQLMSTCHKKFYIVTSNLTQYCSSFPTLIFWADVKQ